MPQCPHLFAGICAIAWVSASKYSSHGWPTNRTSIAKKGSSSAAENVHFFERHFGDIAVKLDTLIDCSHGTKINQSSALWIAPNFSSLEVSGRCVVAGGCRSTAATLNCDGCRLRRVCPLRCPQWLSVVAARLCCRQANTDNRWANMDLTKPQQKYKMWTLAAVWTRSSPYVIFRGRNTITANLLKKKNCSSHGQHKADEHRTQVAAKAIKHHRQKIHVGPPVVCVGLSSHYMAPIWVGWAHQSCAYMPHLFVGVCAIAWVSVSKYSLHRWPTKSTSIAKKAAAENAHFFESRLGDLASYRLQPRNKKPFVLALFWPVLCTSWEGFWVLPDGRSGPLLCGLIVNCIKNFLLWECLAVAWLQVVAAGHMWFETEEKGLGEETMFFSMGDDQQQRNQTFSRRKKDCNSKKKPSQRTTPRNRQTFQGGRCTAIYSVTTPRQTCGATTSSDHWRPRNRQTP